jgi:hypothetical protein
MDKLTAMYKTCIAAALVMGSADTASANVFDVGLGPAIISANGGGEALTKFGGGVATVLGVGTHLRPKLILFGRLYAASTIEDEQHAHDDLLLTASLRMGSGRLWFEPGLGLGFYRGRYRYDSFFDDANYDSEIATPTLVLGGGATLYRGEALDVFGRLDLAISPFGGEVATALLQATFGVSLPF